MEAAELTPTGPGSIVSMWFDEFQDHLQDFKAQLSGDEPDSPKEDSQTEQDFGSPTDLDSDSNQENGGTGAAEVRTSDTSPTSGEDESPLITTTAEGEEESGPVAQSMRFAGDMINAFLDLSGDLLGGLGVLAGSSIVKASSILANFVRGTPGLLDTVTDALGPHANTVITQFGAGTALGLASLSSSIDQNNAAISQFLGYATSTLTDAGAQYLSYYVLTNEDFHEFLMYYLNSSEQDVEVMTQMIADTVNEFAAQADGQIVANGSSQIMTMISQTLSGLEPVVKSGSDNLGNGIEEFLLASGEGTGDVRFPHLDKATDNLGQLAADLVGIVGYAHADILLAFADYLESIGAPGAGQKFLESLNDTSAEAIARLLHSGGHVAEAIAILITGNESGASELGKDLADLIRDWAEEDNLTFSNPDHHADIFDNLANLLRGRADTIDQRTDAYETAILAISDAIGEGGLTDDIADLIEDTGETIGLIIAMGGVALDNGLDTLGAAIQNLFYGIADILDGLPEDVVGNILEAVKDWLNSILPEELNVEFDTKINSDGIYIHLFIELVNEDGDNIAKLEKEIQIGNPHEN